MSKLTEAKNFLHRQPRWRLIAIGAVLVMGGIWWFKGEKGSTAKALTFTARRGPLEITVLEGGSLQALESQEIKCEVRVGYQGTKILKIVEEGYFVTEDDVRTNKVLCELDSSELQKQIVQQEIQYQTAMASLTDAQQNYEIQISQNETDIKAAEQKARFARMDFDKLLGDMVTAQIIADLSLDKLAANPSNVEATVHAEEVTGGPSGGAMAAALEIESPPESRSWMTVDFSKFANIEALGDGEAKQKLRKLEDDLQVAQKELGQTRTALEGTHRLFEKGFVPKTEVTRDEISYESSRLKVQTAETARALYLKYEFNKSAEEALSKYVDALREQDKARRVAISRLAQARARLNSAKGQFEVQSRQRKDLQEQLANARWWRKSRGWWCMAVVAMTAFITAAKNACAKAQRCANGKRLSPSRT